MSVVAVGSPAASYEVSIVVGTLNRCDMLERSLTRLLGQTCDPARFEIIVVDNGSTDGTAELSRRFAKRAPNLRYVTEARKGLSNARNRGIAEAAAPLVSFMDDDGEAEPDWLDTVLRVFREEPGIDAVGGPVRVRWPNDTNTKPEWVPQAFEGYFGGCDHGPVRRRLTYPDYPFGTNMTIRRDQLLRIKGFDARLGPTGQNNMAGGEMDMFYRLYTLSPAIVYEPSAVVHHWTTPSRMTRAFAMRRSFTHGLGSARIHYSRGHQSRLYWAKQLVAAAAKGMVGAVSAAIGHAGGAAPAVVTSRWGTTVYWGGVTRGAVANLFAKR